MKKNNYVLLSIGLLTLSSCSGLKVPQSRATTYESKYSIEEEVLNRKVASEESEESKAKYKMCFESRFNTKTLKQEVADYERKVIGSPVQGYWRHINLENLPIPQANFLKKFGDRIGDLANPDSINYESCSSLPCIFNRIYAYPV